MKLVYFSLPVIGGIFIMEGLVAPRAAINRAAAAEAYKQQQLHHEGIVYNSTVAAATCNRKGGGDGRVGGDLLTPLQQKEQEQRRRELQSILDAVRSKTERASEGAGAGTAGSAS